jgi:hypothetical protein
MMPLIPKWRLRKHAIVVTIIFFADIGLGRSQGFNIPDGNDPCRSISDPTVRTRCYETSNAFGKQTSAQSTTLPGGWRLVRTPNPQSGMDTISISHTAEVQKSDPNFAGMMLRCDEGQVEVLMIVLEPYPPLAPIDVTIAFSNRPTSKYRASIVPPGVMVRLPPEAAASISEEGRKVDELSMSLANGAAPMTSGVVKLTGFEQALGTLRKLCTPS